EAVEAPSSDVQPVVDETVSTDVTEEPVAVPVVEVPVSEEPVPADKPVEDVIDETSGVNGDVQEYAYLTAIDGYMKTLPEGPVRYESKDSVPIAEGVKPAQDLTVLVVASESHNAEQGREASKGLKESKFKPAVKGLKGVEPDTETVVSENVPITIKKADEVPTSQRASWDKLGSMSEPTFIRRGRRMSYKDGVLVSTKEKDPLDDFDKSQAERIKRATMTVTRPEEEKVVEKKEEPKLSELVRPSVRNLAVPPMEIKDEVVDVMRFAVPNIMSDEFGEEDLSEIPDDGIEALCCQVTSCPEAVPSDGCPAVFSFGNGDSEPDGIRFFFGSY
ncbi:MAG: hypothetical protein J5674_05465, partial [Candidatus Methanomethylophilaceae archaeon]|nr:hypothetical protein [Candidatus Methanomethylophilaceae archaeon]